VNVPDDILEDLSVSNSSEMLSVGMDVQAIIFDICITSQEIAGAHRLKLEDCIIENLQ
jgi:hypothetical protein